MNNFIEFMNTFWEGYTENWMKEFYMWNKIAYFHFSSSHSYLLRMFSFYFTRVVCMNSKNNNKQLHQVD